MKISIERLVREFKARYNLMPEQNIVLTAFALWVEQKDVKNDFNKNSKQVQHDTGAHCVRVNTSRPAR